MVHDVVVWKIFPPLYRSLFRVFSKFEGKWTKNWRRRLKSFFADICDHLCNQNGQSDSNFRHHKVFHYFSLLYFFSWFDIKCQRIFFYWQKLKSQRSIIIKYSYTCELSYSYISICWKLFLNLNNSVIRMITRQSRSRISLGDCEILEYLTLVQQYYNFRTILISK